MKKYECKKCKSDDLFIEEKGSNIGLYCSACGAWQTWLSKTELVLVKRFLDSKISDTTKFVNTKNFETKIYFHRDKESNCEIQDKAEEKGFVHFEHLRFLGSEIEMDVRISENEEGFEETQVITLQGINVEDKKIYI